MPIQIKLGRKPIDIKYDDLKAMIARGEIAPSTLIKGNILTDDEWWTIDNVWIFHKCSPEKYPYGEKLQDQMEIKRRRKVQEYLIAAQFNSYYRGDLIEDRYYLELLDRIVSEPEILGVSRLFYLPSHEPERIFTFEFKTDLVRIEVVEGPTSVWSSIPQRISGATNSGLWLETMFNPFRASQQIRATGSIRIKDLPNPIRSWEDLVVNSSKAGDFLKSYGTGGVCYRHKMGDDETSLDVFWVNPRQENHPDQYKLIQWYRDCTNLVGLERFWEQTHSERRHEERERELSLFRDWARENYPEIAGKIWNNDGSRVKDFQDYGLFSRLFDEWQTDVGG